MVIRAHTMKDMPFHCKAKRDFFLWMPPWLPTPSGSIDFNDPRDRAKLSYGAVVLFFKAWITPTPGGAGKEHDLAFIEELWEYKTEGTGVKSLLESEFGCTHLYSASPRRVYYVVDTWRILSPAAVMLNPCNLTIPHGALPKSKRVSAQVYPEAKQDSAPGKGDGSPMYVVNQWAMNWGQHSAADRRC